MSRELAATACSVADEAGSFHPADNIRLARDEGITHPLREPVIIEEVGRQRHGAPPEGNRGVQRSGIVGERRAL